MRNEFRRESAARGEVIAALRARVAELRKALKPFAAATEDWPTPEEWEADCQATGHIISFPAEDKDSLNDWKHGLTVGDCRRARAALEMSGGVK